jgi:uncharacterized membrane protein YphA (DoxX/SURF4 family)
MNLLLTANDINQKTLTRLSCFEGLALLALRLYLVPVFWMAGINFLKRS